jgi:microcystin-dependent protein
VSDQFIGEIQAFPFPFALQGGFSNAWMPCLGQLLPLQAYSALFALIGTYYGGNGTTNFQLPNLAGSVVISQGQGPGLSIRMIGERVGSSTATLMSNEMARHTHGLQLGTRASADPSPGPGTASNMMAIDPGMNGYAALSTNNTTLAPNAITTSGQGLSHDNMQPTQVLIWCIAYSGIFPSFG